MANYNYWPRYGAENYSFTMPLEDGFNPKESTEWMQRNWLHSLTSSALYIIVIFGGQKLMESRKPFALDGPLFWWNFGLAVFSIVGFLRMTPEWWWAVKENSFEYSVCVASFAQGVSGFWTEKFAHSKVAELFDTAFIVARKRPLLFLHWYHHVTVLVYTWHAYKDHTASGRWFIWMNYGVHAVMYSYYALRALRVRTPKAVAMLITVLQISQMIMGIFIGILVFYIKLQGGYCQQSNENLALNLTMYATYFILFCNFFYHAYLKKNNRYSVLSKKDSTKTASIHENFNGKESVAPTPSDSVRITRRRAQKVE